MFRVAPDKPGKFRVHCVCLEHGKPEPNNRMKYTLIPLENLNSDPRVATVCRLLGYGQVNQGTAQAAAWHFANGLTWEQLAHKNRSESQYTGNVPWFHPAELEAAVKLTATIQYQHAQATLAAQQTAATSTSGSTSENPLP
jgi:hypothetical protein